MVEGGKKGVVVKSADIVYNTVQVQFVFVQFLSDNFREPASSDDGEGVPLKKGR